MTGTPRPLPFRERVLGWTGQIARSPLFWIVLALKLVVSGLAGSDYLTQLFVPFIGRFVAEPLSNPYQTFWSMGLHSNFPYPALMLFIEGLPHLALRVVGLGDLGPRALLVLYRLPLLAADIAIFLILCRWLRTHVALLLRLYWACPLLFYISYVHGQLDAIPVALLMACIYCLISGRHMLAAVLLGCALATKTHIIVSLPIALVYLWQNTSRKKLVAKFLVLSLAVFLFWNLPYIASTGFLRMVFLNPEQGRVGLAQIPVAGGSLAFFIIPALIAGLIAYSLHIHIHNRDLLLSFIGFCFGSILLFVAPAQGWYFWIVPFFAYFFARLSLPYLALFMLLQAAYFLFFALIPGSDYVTVWQFGGAGRQGTLFDLVGTLGINPQLPLNIGFTALQTVLLLCCAVVYHRGIRLAQQHKLTARPYMIGIAGDSGAGKSTLSDGLRALFGARHLDVICGDDMHKWQRGHDRWVEFTHLDPRANELHNELHYLRSIRQNRLIWRRHYDHNTGRFTEDHPIKPRSVMILEGLHAYYLKPARELYDLKIFVKPDADVLLHRKVVRDMRKRNYTKEAVIAAVEKRMADSRKYIVTQERFADIVVSFLSREAISADDIGRPDLAIDERLRITLSNAYFFDTLVDDLHEAVPGNLHHYYDDHDLQVLEFDRPLDIEDIRALAEKHLDGLQDFGVYDPQWRPGWEGLLQLVLGYCIFHGWHDRHAA
ncbi:hypothetical protein GCM10011390_49860 [Aureimonas endophytica]|uniref:phosphoribulokinase n=1 Tax=Aureimonas endophytica TaxID=2027858 RepID=A0A917ECZ6_9HYPH|nr:hypothetical protein [Aureimonas endophytica]GGE24469.1 hypothetical protein GCM10011390_49860 [Aureimonas endophytica]